MTRQPNWELVGSMGDADILNYSGTLIYRDKTGVYDPELEVYDADYCEVSRIMLERCTYIDGVLSDNQFHPGHEVWWARKLDGMVESTGLFTKEQLIEMFCSDDPQKLGDAYYELTLYFGCFEFDQYPLKLTKKEAEERYKEL